MDGESRHELSGVLRAGKGGDGAPIWRDMAAFQTGSSLRQSVRSAISGSFFHEACLIESPWRACEARFQMKVYSALEVAEWFKRFDDAGAQPDYVHADGDGLFFTHPEASCIDLEYPAKLEQLPSFARMVASIGYEEQHFDGAMLWVQHWGVWNPVDESIGYRIVEKINAAAGQPTSFEAAPGHRFRADELPDAIGLLLQPMIFAWEGFYLPEWSYGGGSDYFLHISHHSVVEVVTRTKEFQDKVVKQMNEMNLNPTLASAERLSRFCRSKRVSS